MSWEGGDLRRQLNRAMFVLVIPVGLLFVGIGVYELYNNLTTPWEVAKGEVVKSEVVKGGGKRASWRAAIEYKYAYGGSEYRGVHRWSHFWGDKDNAGMYASQHPPGIEVGVKVNPANPRESRLKRGFIEENGFGLGAALSGLVLAGLGCLDLYRKKR